MSTGLIISIVITLRQVLTIAVLLSSSKDIPIIRHAEVGTDKSQIARLDSISSVAGTPRSSVKMICDIQAPRWAEFQLSESRSSLQGTADVDSQVDHGQAGQRQEDLQSDKLEENADYLITCLLPS